MRPLRADGEAGPPRHRLDASERAAGVTDQDNRIMEEN
jgi:hypothetical protein